MTRVQITVDGKRYEDDVEPRLLLVHYLRDVLGKTGTNIGRDTSNCGACTGHLDGTSEGFVRPCNDDPNGGAILRDNNTGPSRDLFAIVDRQIQERRHPTRCLRCDELRQITSYLNRAKTMLEGYCSRGNQRRVLAERRLLPGCLRELGATLALAGVIFALRGIGTMLMDVPAGIMVSRLGERTSVAIGSALLVLASIGAAHSTSVLMYAAMILLLGASWAIWLLARFTYISEHAPLEHRGRAIALLAGTNRAGNFIGPFMGGFAASAFGIGAVYYIQGTLIAIAALAILIFVRDGGRPSAIHGDRAYPRLLSVIAEHRRVFLTAGVAARTNGAGNAPGRWSCGRWT